MDENKNLDGTPKTLPRYWPRWGVNFKFLYAMFCLIPLIMSPIIYFSEPQASSMVYSKEQDAAILLAIGLSLLLLYLLYLRFIDPIFKSYVPKPGNPKDWND